MITRCVKEVTVYLSPWGSSLQVIQLQIMLCLPKYGEISLASQISSIKIISGLEAMHQHIKSLLRENVLKTASNLYKIYSKMH